MAVSFAFCSVFSIFADDFLELTSRRTLGQGESVLIKSRW